MAKTALITGASAGLGLELARLFAADGHDLALVARRRDRLDEIARELNGKYGIKTRVIAIDLGDRGAASKIPGEVARHAYSAMLAGRPVAIHGIKNKIGIQALRVSPRSAVRAIAASLNRG